MDAKKVVLLIEDNPLLTGLYSARLNKEGLETIIVHNGEEGLKMIDEHKPDMVLLDINMPLLSGIEVLEKIRSNPKTKNLKVIILTISDRVEDRERAIELGIYDYLIKADLRLDEIAKKVLSCLGS